MSFKNEDEEREAYASIQDHLEILEGELKRARESMLLPEVKQKLTSMKKRIEFILEEY